MSQTICELFLNLKSNRKTSILKKSKKEWQPLTWSFYFESSCKIALGLKELGVQEGECVALFSNTRYEWSLVDMAILGSKAVTVPIYASALPQEITFILNDSHAKVLVCENSQMLEKLVHLKETCPKLEHVVLIEPPQSKEPSFHPELSIPLTNLSDLILSGQKLLDHEPSWFEQSLSEVSSEDLATIVYTSGTTGIPKGVLIGHSQILSEIQSLAHLLQITSQDVSLTLLPFTHILGRVEHWMHIFCQFTMAYVENIEKLPEYFRTVRPTVMVGVPRIFEKIQNRITTKMEISPTKNKLFQWAIDVGIQVSQHQQERRSIPFSLLIKYQTAKKVILDQIQNGFGGRLRLAFCGGAPLSIETANFFQSIGILLLEGYGLTETTAAVCCNSPFNYKFGTVGPPLPNVEVQIHEDGEILVKGPMIMMGYHNQQEQPFQNGFFPTGDIGYLEEGRLIITDRKKNLIKTAGGKYVAPQRLENLLTASPYISSALIHGDRRKHIVALISIDIPTIKQYASENAISYKDDATLTQHPKIKSLIRKTVAETNSHLAHFETIKNFLIVPHSFSIETGELTPSSKIRRKYCEEKYKDELNRLY